MKGNKELNIPGLRELTSISANVSDLKQEVNDINSKIKDHDTQKIKLREQLNMKLLEIEKIEKNEEKLK